MHCGQLDTSLFRAYNRSTLAIVGAAVTVTVEEVTRQEQPLDTRVAEYWLT